MDCAEKRQEIRERLWDQLATAETALTAAKAEFSLLNKKSPAGVPSPGGELSLRETEKKSSQTLQRYLSALKQFTDFALYGTIPEAAKPLNCAAHNCKEDGSDMALAQGSDRDPGVPI